MKFILPLTLLASALLATNVEAKWHPEPGLSWDYLLGADSSVAKKSDKQVVTIDLEQADGLVSYLHGKGQKVICYFSGGTMQKSRAIDYADYEKANIALSETSGWGNHYIDIRNKAKLQPLLRARMKRAKSYGCDAVEVDSIGLYVHNIKDYTKEDTIVFGKWLAETAHSEDLSIGLKNVAGCAEALESYFDFAVVESCAESPNLCALYDVFTQHGKAVFTVHYKNRIGALGSNPQATLSKELGGHKFTCAFSDHQELHHNSSNFDCSKGNYGSDVGSQPTTTKTTTTTTTTTVVKTTTTTVVVTPTNTTAKEANATNAPSVTDNIGAKNATETIGAAGAAGASGAASGVVGAPGAVGAAGTGAAGTGAAGAAGATKQAGANNANKGNDKELNEINSNDDGSGVGTAVAIVAAGGGIATAAVAGFVFLKKHKKFSSNDEEFNLGF